MTSQSVKITRTNHTDRDPCSHACINTASLLAELSREYTLQKTSDLRSTTDPYKDIALSLKVSECPGGVPCPVTVTKWRTVKICTRTSDRTRINPMFCDPEDG
ncbi:hypothetical protein CBL_03457 [Carabus blaptoides fortunei]